MENKQENSKNLSPEDTLFIEARRLQKNKDYEGAEKKFTQTMDSYIDNPDLDKKMLAFECALNVAINKIKFENWKPTKLGYDVYEKIIKDLMLNLDVLEKKIKAPEAGNEKITLKIMRARIQIYRIVEQYLRNAGLDERALEMSKDALDLQVDTMKFERKSPLFSRAEKFWSCVQEGALRFLGRCFDYGLNIVKIIVMSISIWFVWGLFYFSLTYIKSGWGIFHQHLLEKYPANFAECLFYSAVTFTNIGTEEYWPIGWLCKFLVSIEGIGGFIILGILVSYLARRIK